ncbi:S41 family peptidase [Streptomyces sp. FIT100]|uniref:S41 family peptidase n=1 Tax=Streptomyces sp. FIT100 TaxID=2837956 RepID=UPI0021C72EA7|nr:S41 family peptidase [Streptomyces sp. FIT100]UUN27183.1 PDZ domain-containing protein [Streptomyces sp. FIT100]
MSGPESPLMPRGFRRGAALTLLFASVLVTASARGLLPDGDGELSSAGSAATAVDNGGSDRAEADRDAVARAAAEAMADGKSAAAAAEEVVSRSGDRWGAVYDKREYEEFAQALDGSYTGVGLWAKRAADGRVEVSRVQRGGPAERAGIRVGDRIRAIDGKPIDGRPVSQVVALLRGDGKGAERGATAKVGSTVALGLQRGAHTWTETLRRARLATEAVTVHRLADHAVMIKVAAFTKGSGERVREAVRRAPAGAGVLLDLRGNSGGLVTEAVTAASAFLDGGLVATYDVHGEQKALYAGPGGDTERPVVALVDGGTMSAAELVTGALQDRGRAVTVGSRTFGKASVQMPEPLPDGSVAELTVGHYRTPAGHDLDGKGITPDLAVSERAEERARTVLSGLGTGS